MKKRNKRHSPEQIVKKLRDAEVMLSGGKSIEEVLKALEVSEATFHRWRNQYGGMKSEEAKRLKDLEGENVRLKRLLAEAELDKSMLKEAVLSVPTFWSFQREFSRRTGRNVLNSIQLIDLPDPGTKMGPRKPKHARRRHMTTVSRNSFVQHKTLRMPFDTESLDQPHAAG